MNYRSTRSNETVTAEEALLKGLAADGGLYVPEQLPDPFLDADVLKAMSYEELAAFVLHHFLTDITLKDLSKLTHDAYTGTWTGGKFQLSEMPGLWKEDRTVWRKQH
jgi:threonine synthase